MHNAVDLNERFLAVAAAVVLYIGTNRLGRGLAVSSGCTAALAENPSHLNWCFEAAVQLDWWSFEVNRLVRKRGFLCLSYPRHSLPVHGVLLVVLLVVLLPVISKGHAKGPKRTLGFEVSKAN